MLQLCLWAAECQEWCNKNISKIKKLLEKSSSFFLHLRKNKNMLRNFIFLFLFNCFLINSQNINALDKKIQNYFKLDRENIYLHLNKETYFSNETDEFSVQGYQHGGNALGIFMNYQPYHCRFPLLLDQAKNWFQSCESPKKPTRLILAM